VRHHDQCLIPSHPVQEADDRSLDGNRYLNSAGALDYQADWTHAVASVPRVADMLDQIGQFHSLLG
jgi:hypothetical protein